MRPHTRTSSAGCEARGPAVQSTFIGVQLGREHVVIGDHRQQVLMDDVLVRQANLGLLFLEDDLVNGKMEKGKDQHHTAYQDLTVVQLSAFIDDSKHSS